MRKKDEEKRTRTGAMARCPSGWGCPSDRGPTVLVSAATSTNTKHHQDILTAGGSVHYIIASPCCLVLSCSLPSRFLVQHYTINGHCIDLVFIPPIFNIHPSSLNFNISLVGFYAFPHIIHAIEYVQEDVIEIHQKNMCCSDRAEFKTCSECGDVLRCGNKLAESPEWITEPICQPE